MIGQKISHYKIVEKLGEGGMGVVYKAEDTKLERLAALKFLPPHLAASEQDKARFAQEAKAAAALSHPNVCSIYDIQEHDGQMFIVMEYVEGQTLRDKKENFSIKQVIDIGIQLADGLATAHEHGIVHRDIKPENIMVRKDGIVQIMDFGLAKLQGVTRLTKEGSTIGTVGYMSPEQVQGFDTDHRTDIFSLGVVLYELLAGQSPFQGVHETAIFYDIVNVDPAPVSSLRQEVDPALDAIILECLAKEPEDRYQSAKEVTKELKRFKRESSRQRVSRVSTARPAYKSPTEGEAGKVEVKPPRKRFLWPALSGLLTVAVILLAWRSWKADHISTNPVMRFSVSLPATEALDFSSGFSALAISPDGKYLVYISTGEGKSQLFLRPMDKLTATPIPGTENAGDPFFSADGQWVAFFSQGMLKKVSVYGGAPQDIADIKGIGRAGWWGTDGTIVFGHINRSLSRVSSEGGEPEAVTKLDATNGEISHRFPQILPGGKAVLFTIKLNSIATFDEAIVAVERLDTGERKIVIRGGTYARYIPTGHLVYARNKSLFVVPFDLEHLEVLGPPAEILDGGMLNQHSGSASFGFSNTGVLVYVPGGPLPIDYATLVWTDRHGNIKPLLETPRSYFSAVLSPDGQKLALSVYAANDDIWVYHIVRGTLTRLTFGGGNNGRPIWTPDGRHLVYFAEKGRAANIFRKPWDGSGVEERLTENSDAQIPNSVSPDGKMLAFTQGGDIWILPMDEEQKPRQFIQTQFSESQASFSPDGRWIAYRSDESGKNEVYVVSYPNREGKWQVSTGGGSNPMWSRSGKELFYVNVNKVMAVNVAAQATFSASVPKKLFEVRSSEFGPLDISPDGQRFILGVIRGQELTTTQLNVVLEWFKELQEEFSVSE